MAIVDTLPQLGQGHQESVQTSSIKLKEAGSSHAIENSAPPLYPKILKISRDPGLHIPLKRKRDDFCYEQDPDSGLTRPDVVLFPLTSLLEPPDDESEENIDLAIVTSGAAPPQGARPLSFNGLKSPSATPREPVSSALGRSALASPLEPPAATPLFNVPQPRDVSMFEVNPKALSSLEVSLETCYAPVGSMHDSRLANNLHAVSEWLADFQSRYRDPDPIETGPSYDVAPRAPTATLAQLLRDTFGLEGSNIADMDGPKTKRRKASKSMHAAQKFPEALDIENLTPFSDIGLDRYESVTQSENSAEPGLDMSHPRSPSHKPSRVLTWNEELHPILARKGPLSRDDVSTLSRILSDITSLSNNEAKATEGDLRLLHAALVALASQAALDSSHFPRHILEIAQDLLDRWPADWE
ncbi:unnamed protein product [Mycena citricolor]|uniref:Uncharacterized protein n=1 Tax=Mycena citricolor TaxID=2018698 RepID=A0AAD2Q5E6_9AGAR|nr:unnamed protein product [Mycena citricolor]